MKNLIILFIVFVAILITALIVYPTKPVSPYEELGIWDSFKQLFSKPKQKEVTKEELVEEFIQNYLKPDFRPPELNLILKDSQVTGRSYHTFGWMKGGDDFQVKVEYNNDGTLSHLTLHTFGIAGNKSANYFFLISDVGFNCFKINRQKLCKASWVDGKNRMDLLVGLTVDDYTHYIYLCKMFKESEVYDKICGMV